MGFEPTVFCSGNRRDIHYATGTKCLLWESNPGPSVSIKMTLTGVIPLCEKGYLDLPDNTRQMLYH